MYNRANHAQMITIENQLENIKVHSTPNIVDQSTQFVTPKGAKFLGKQVNRS